MAKINSVLGVIDTADLGSLFWAGFLILGLSRVVRNSWHGVELDRAVVEALRQAVRDRFPAGTFTRPAHSLRQSQPEILNTAQGA